MPTCIATFQVYLSFQIPKDVKKYLMTESQKCDLDAETKPGYWWIKYGTFFYLDKEGKEQQIHTEDYTQDYKRPTDVEFDDTE